MNKRAVLTLCVCVLAAFGSEGAFGASDGEYWPTWRGPNRAGACPKGNPPLTWSETENIKWKVKLEQINQIYASPAGAAGRVYIVGRNGVTCVLTSSENFDLLAVNKLDDPIDRSPAFVDNELFLKGKECLYCIAKP